MPYNVQLESIKFILERTRLYPLPELILPPTALVRFLAQFFQLAHLLSILLIKENVS